MCSRQVSIGRTTRSRRATPSSAAIRRSTPCLTLPLLATCRVSTPDLWHLDGARQAGGDLGFALAAALAQAGFDMTAVGADAEHHQALDPGGQAPDGGARAVGDDVAAGAQGVEQLGRQAVAQPRADQVSRKPPARPRASKPPSWRPDAACRRRRLAV